MLSRIDFFMTVLTFFPGEQESLQNRSSFLGRTRILNFILSPSHTQPSSFAKLSGWDRPPLAGAGEQSAPALASTRHLPQ